MIKNSSEKIDLDILGMECINCAGSIKTYLEKIKGVSSAEINFSSETASVIFHPDIISLAEIKSIIRKLGYDVAEDEEEDALELQKIKLLRLQQYKIIVSVLLTLLVMGITMSTHYEFLSLLNFGNIFNLIALFLLSGIVVFWCGSKFLIGAFNSLKSLSATMDTTISMGTLSSFIYSSVIAANHIFSLGIKVLSNSHETYFETSVMIVTFILIGNYLEAVLKSKTQTSIKNLKALRSKFVTVLRDNIEILIPFKKVKVNDIVIIKAGERIPVDGNIITGSCIVDESAMTGESMPVEKLESEEILSGTILINGVVKISATRVGKDTTLSKVINLVKEASNSKPKIQKFADKVSAVFVPVVIFISVITFLIWHFFIGYSFDNSLLYAVSVLIIACPCALGLASPMAVVIGIGRAAENGILFNNIEAIEKLNKVDTLCFDKTGTLTEGIMAVKSVLPLNGFSKTDVLKYTASLEKYSNHPIAKSVTGYINSLKINVFEDVSNIMNDEGMGIKGLVNGKVVVLGNIRMMNSNNISIESKDETSNKLFIGVNGLLAGEIEFADIIKKESLDAVKCLKEMNFNLYMISGDNKAAAENIASEVGINEFSFNTLPEAKAEIIKQLQSNGKIVAMIGDGINDAPSLAAANVGIAVGTGQDIAIDSADAVLVKGDLRNISNAILLSVKTVSIIKQNIFWAFFYNVLAIPLAAGIFIPWGIYISPVMAAMLMAFSDVVTVIGNSLRLKYFKLN